MDGAGGRRGLIPVADLILGHIDYAVAAWSHRANVSLAVSSSSGVRPSRGPSANALTGLAAVAVAAGHEESAGRLLDDAAAALRGLARGTRAWLCTGARCWRFGGGTPTRRSPVCARA
jgi:hypothetical protein